jgi:hypothetical protein
MLSTFASDISGVADFVIRKQQRITYMCAFFIIAGFLSLIAPELRPIIAAAALVLPIRAFQKVTVNFEEDDYYGLSPMLNNKTDYRFVAVIIPLSIIPAVTWYLGIAPDWSSFGSLVHIVGSVTIFTLAWSEGVYQKNFYFDRWHPIERGTLVASGILAVLVTPLFLPLFIIVHRVVTVQFRYPGIGKFNYTHSRLPLTIIFILGAFAIVGTITDIHPEQVIFLLFCGYAAHYFHPGVAKLSNGPIYYLRQNNPFYMFLNAYKIGWLSELDERIVLAIGKYTDRVKPLLNIIVVLIEAGSVVVLLWYPLAIVIVALILSLHVLILLSTGDNFWKWMSVNISILVGLLFTFDQIPAPFIEFRWFALSIPFVIFAHAWMNPVGMDWLDVPYVEYFRFEAEHSDNGTVCLHSNVFRPYDTIMTQGITGTLTYLGTNPRITYSHGAVTNGCNKKFHNRIVNSLHCDPPDEEQASQLIEEYGVEQHDPEKTALFKSFVRRFLNTNTTTMTDKILRLLSSPREFYSAGISDRKSHRQLPDIKHLSVVRVDGIWTNDGFEELNREEVISIER